MNVAGQLEAAKQAGWLAAVQHYGIREAPAAAPVTGRRGGSHRKGTHLRLVPPGVAGAVAFVSWKPAVGAVAAAAVVAGGAAVTLHPQTIGIDTGPASRPFATSAGPAVGWDEPPAIHMPGPSTVARKPAAAPAQGGAALAAGLAQAVPTVTLTPAPPAVISPPAVTAAAPVADPAVPVSAPVQASPAAATAAPASRYRSDPAPAESVSPVGDDPGFLSSRPSSSGYQGRHRQDQAPTSSQYGPGDHSEENPGHRGGQGFLQLRRGAGPARLGNQHLGPGQ